MLIDTKSHWEIELRNKASCARIASEFLVADDIAALSDVLFCGAFIARRLLEEAENAKTHIGAGEYHFDKVAVLKIHDLLQRKHHLKGCWMLDGRKPDAKLVLSATETLGMKDLLSQIIHADPIQLWKTPNIDKPCFWVASKIASSPISADNGGKRALFYRVYWEDYAATLEEFANSLSPISE